MPPELHPDEELLAAVAMDDADDLSAQQRAHVRGCATCTSAVDELRRTALRVRASTRAETTAPGPHLWEAVVRETESEPPASAGAVPAHVRERRSRTFSTPVVAAAVALALVVGGVVGALLGRRTPEATPAPQDTVLARAELSVLDGDADRGLAQVVRRGDQVELRVWGAHLGGAAGVHEVWLINRDQKRLVALGMLGAGESGTFVMPARLLDEGYVLVDVSLEPDDGDPAHSGDSLARGQLRQG